MRPSDIPHSLRSKLDKYRQRWRLAAARRAVDELRQHSPADPNARSALAAALQQLAYRSAAAGEILVAVPVIDEAVGIERELASRLPDRHVPALAASLRGKSVLLAVAGRDEDAVESMQEAVRIWRSLPEEDAVKS